ncbi:MAG: ROK family protein, partial [Halofilum sp. (in: g-proteobacteria)]
MRIGIDLGGTKTAGIALDDDGTMLARCKLPTPRGDYDATLNTIVAAVKQLEDETGQRGSIGVGTPGAISPATGLFKNANAVCMNGRRGHGDLEDRLDRKIHVANDADCFALSEAVDGAGAGYRIVFGAILGTGCGGGVIIDHRVLVGPNALTGEWGHNPLPWQGPEEYPGPECYCGRKGCIERWVSGSALAEDHHQAAGERLEAVEIAARAKQGDPQALATLDRYEDRLARSLGSVINMLDPEVIVLGGG